MRIRKVCDAWAHMGAVLLVLFGLLAFVIDEAGLSAWAAAVCSLLLALAVLFYVYGGAALFEELDEQELRLDDPDYAAVRDAAEAAARGLNGHQLDPRSEGFEVFRKAVRHAINKRRQR